MEMEESELERSSPSWGEKGAQEKSCRDGPPPWGLVEARDHHGPLPSVVELHRDEPLSTEMSAGGADPAGSDAASGAVVPRGRVEVRWWLRGGGLGVVWG